MAMDEEIFENFDQAGQAAINSSAPFPDIDHWVDIRRQGFDPQTTAVAMADKLRQWVLTRVEGEAVNPDSLPEVLRGLSAEAIQAATDELFDKILNSSEANELEFNTERSAQKVEDDLLGLDPSKVEVVEVRDEPGGRTIVHRNKSDSHSEVSKVRYRGPIQMKIMHLGLGESLTMSADNAANERPPKNFTDLWKEPDTVSQIQTFEGATILTTHSLGLTYLTDSTGQRLTPGFEQIEVVGNEGMIATSANQTYLITASDSNAAIRNYQQRRADDWDLTYPFFLCAPEFMVTRFDQENAKVRGHHTLLQLQGKDPFGFEKGQDRSANRKGQDIFDKVMEMIRAQEATNPQVITYVIKDGAIVQFSPVITIRKATPDQKQVKARMVVSSYEDGSTVVSLQEPLTLDDDHPAGMFLVRHANGNVMVIDNALTLVTDGQSSEKGDTFDAALQYAFEYSDLIGEHVMKEQDRAERIQRQKPLFANAWARMMLRYYVAP